MYEEWNNGTQNTESAYSYQSSNGTDAYANQNGMGSNQDKQPKKKKGKGGFGKMVANGAVFGLAAAVVFTGCVAVANQTLLKGDAVSASNAAAKSSQTTKVANTTTATSVAAETTVDGTMTIAQIAENSMPSIVSITSQSVSEVRTMFGTQQYDSTSAGSGIVIGQNDSELLIATNNHVVENADTLSVCFGDSEDAVYEAQVKGTDPDNDLAIVSVKTADMNADVLAATKIATIGSSDDLKVGDQVIAIGNALGYGQSVTTGIISAKNREVTIEDLTASLIQTDTAINPGNSGGALLNMKGELIGINSAKFASSQVEGMGYAIPIDTAEPILEELMTRETRDKLDTSESGYLGISCQSVDSDVSEMYGIPEGVYVLGATEGSAAANAGIQKGDIITKFDGQSVDSVDDLKSTLLYYAAGEMVDVVIERSDNGAYVEQTITVTLDRNTADAQTDTQSEAQSDQNSGNSNGSGSDEQSIEDFFNQFGVYGDGSDGSASGF